MPHRDEQLRRRQFVEAFTPDVKAEWIDGKAVYHVSEEALHGQTVRSLSFILDTYSLYGRSLHVRSVSAMAEVGPRLFMPDVYVWRASEHSFARDMLLYPRPDLAVEVLSPRTRKRDLGKKKTEYAIAGTHEYWVIDTDADTLTRYVNAGGQFDETEVVNVSGTVTSSLLPELGFPLNAFWEDDLRRAWTTQLVSGAL